MKILILSNYPWQNNGSFGNTYSSIFGKVPNTEIAHIYMFDGKPDPVENITAYYQILEREVMKSCFKSRTKSPGVGKRIEVPSEVEVEIPKTKQEKVSVYGKLLAFGKRHHWSLLFMARELAWKYGHVNYEGVMKFVEEFKPDIFFLPYSYVYYTNRIALYIKEHYDFPMVMEMAMDHYTLNRLSWNPIFWLDRFGKRKQIRRLAKKSEMMFVISKKLKDYLEEDLDIPCKVLYKTPDKNRRLEKYNPTNETVKFLYTGNIYSNRWKSLALLVQELKAQNFGFLDIYTDSPITSAIDKALNVNGFSKIHPPVSQRDVINLQNTADVLVHAEAFDKYNKSLVRCAISTKIMDYLSVGRCILAIGPSDISSIEYLADGDLALIANSKERLTQIVSTIKKNKQIIADYASKGREYVVNQLDEDKIRKSFYDELQRVIDEYKKIK